jgi:thiol reductant ABC exporter CydC subunit
MRSATLRVLGLARPLWRGFALSMLLGLAAVASGVGLLATAAYLIAAASLGPSIADLQVAIVGVRALGLLRGALRYTERLVSHDMAFRLLAEVRSDFFRRLEPRSPADLDDFHSADLLTNLVNDVESLQYLLTRAIAPPLVAIAFTFLLAVVIYPLSPAWVLAETALLVMAGAVVPIWVLQRSAPPSAETADHRSGLQRLVADAVQGMPDVLSFRQVDSIVDRLDAVGQSIVASQQRVAWCESLGEGAKAALVQLAPLGSLLLLRPLLANGSLDGVGLVVLVVTALASFEAIEPLTGAVLGLAQTEAAAGRLFEIVDSAPSVQEPLKAASPGTDLDLEVDDLTVCYPGRRRPALSGLCFHLPSGHRLALVGPSGAGKTTLLKALVRFRAYSDGRIRLGGTDLQDMSGDMVRHLIHLVPQPPRVFSGTVRSNLQLAAPEASDPALMEALDLVGLGARAFTKDGGLQREVGETGNRISAGERQRIGLAQALLRRSPLLLLDEPTAHMDPLQADQVMAHVIDAVPGQTILLATHDLVGLDKMDGILVLEEGRIVQRGTHADLIETEGAYRQRWLFERERAALASVGREPIALPAT